MRDNPISRNIVVETIQTISLTRRLWMRAVRIAANAPKKQQLVSACPLGKLYDSGGNTSKNGSGRVRLKASFRLTFSRDAPTIVIAKSFASRPHFRDANQMMTTAVAHVRNSIEPRNEMPRIAVVIAGDASR